MTRHLLQAICRVLIGVVLFAQLAVCMPGAVDCSNDAGADVCSGFVRPRLD